MVTYYETLGVAEDVPQTDLRAAYKQRALENHPDKGGDADKFDAIQKAFAKLGDDKAREAYDDELEKLRAKVTVEGRPEPSERVAAPREKTAPTPGSKRSAGKAWRHPSFVLKALEDGATQEERANRLFKQYESFDQRAGKEKLRKWTKKLLVKDQQAIKAVAKKKEEEQKKKVAKWLAGP
jgi:curved DNA-binding protein CbpA